jgi:hypothetical protein
MIGDRDFHRGSWGMPGEPKGIPGIVVRIQILRKPTTLIAYRYRPERGRELLKYSPMPPLTPAAGAW